MILPDTKDWTWVLERKCDQCGFDTKTHVALAVPGLTRETAMEWKNLFLAGGVVGERPNENTWSPLEYACHVRDLFRLFHLRISLMKEEDNPIFDNWDQDETAISHRYNEQEPVACIEDLVASGYELADLIDGISPEEWKRTGRRTDGASFKIDTLVLYMIHDPIHHLWDVKHNVTK